MAEEGWWKAYLAMQVEVRSDGYTSGCPCLVGLVRGVGWLKVAERWEGFLSQKVFLFLH